MGLRVGEFDYEIFRRSVMLGTCQQPFVLIVIGMHQHGALGAMTDGGTRPYMIFLNAAQTNTRDVVGRDIAKSVLTSGDGSYVVQSFKESGLSYREMEPTSALRLVQFLVPTEVKDKFTVDPSKVTLDVMSTVRDAKPTDEQMIAMILRRTLAGLGRYYNNKRLKQMVETLGTPGDSK
jgi:hypothetical protein